jgi:hypothetical protein
MRFGSHPVWKGHGMSAASSVRSPVRLATADATAPRSHLAAHGEVAINGSADAAAPEPRAGPPRKRSETVSPPLSPARTALADHLEHLSKLAAEADRKSKPVQRLRDQLAAAHVDLQNAEMVLTNIDALHSAAIAKAARENCCPVEPVQSEGAEQAVQRARRNVNSVRQALEECSQDQIKANSNLIAAATHGDALALAVLVEEFNTRLEDWARKRDKFHLAEIDLTGLLQAIGQRGRDLQASTPGTGLTTLRQLEKMQPPWHHLEHGHVERGGPREVSAAAGRWSAVLSRLGSDPNASF